MTETRTYELTQEQVLEICEALKFQADDLDHREGSRADIRIWAAKAASLWQLVDKFVEETPGIRFLPPALPEVALRKQSQSQAAPLLQPRRASEDRATRPRGQRRILDRLSQG